VRSSYRVSLALTIFAALAACSHGGGTSLPAVQGGGFGTIAVGNPSRGGAKTTLAIRVPASLKSSNAQKRTPQYVSPSTLGASITVYGALATPPPTPTVVADLSSSSPLCTPNSDGSRTCNVQVQAPVGNDDFIVNTYDQAPVNGAIPSGANLLSTSTLQFVIQAGQVNTLPLTLGGVPAAIVLAPPGFLVPPNQTSTFTFTVNAKDADGNYIVGPGNYNAPITLSISGDPNNTISLSTTTIASPATSTVTATYNGGALPGTATITGSAAGATSGSLTVQASSSVTTVTIVVPVPAATNSQTQTVYQQGGYWTIPGAGGYNGSLQYSTNDAPGGTTIAITTSTTAPGTLPNPQPTGTPLVYVSYSVSNATTFTQGIQSLTVTLPNNISTSGQTFYETVYDLTAGTNITPSSNTSVAGTGSDTLTIGPGPVQNPTQTTWPASENYLIVISSTSTSSPMVAVGTGTAINFYTDNATPQLLSTSIPINTNQTALASDAAGDLFVANRVNNTISYYAGPRAGTRSAASTVSTGTYPANALAVDGAGNLYAVVTGAGSSGYVGRLAPPYTAITSTLPTPLAYGACTDQAGDVFVAAYGSDAIVDYLAPNPPSSGSTTFSSQSPDACVVDSGGNLYVANYGANTVTKYAPPYSGVTATILTGINGPTALALDSSGNLFVANSLGDTITYYTAPIGNNASPAAQINVSPGSPQVLAVDPAKNLFAIICCPGSAVVYTPPYTGSAVTLPSSNAAASIAVIP